MAKRNTFFFLSPSNNGFIRGARFQWREGKREKGEKHSLQSWHVETGRELPWLLSLRAGRLGKARR